MKGNARASGYDRHAEDWYVEPPHAVRQLLSAEPFSNDCWDPACGRGTIPRVLKERGKSWLATDLFDRGFGRDGVDFLEQRGPFATCRAANIISNPPYKLMTNWIMRSLALADEKVAIFVPLTLLEGIERNTLFATTPFKRALVFSWRVSCPPGDLAPDFDAPIEAWKKGGSKAYAWFIWEHGYVGEPRLSFLPPPWQRTRGLAKAA